MNRKKLVFVFLLVLSTLTVWAQPFKLDMKKEIAIGGTLLAGEIFHNVYDLTNGKKSWDGYTRYYKGDVNAFDRQFMHSYNKPLSRVGTLLMVGIPLGTLVFNSLSVYKEYEFEGLLTHAVIFAEAILMSHTVPHVVKPLVKRVRPYNYFPGDEGASEGGDHWEQSFFSGHTTMVFAAATAASYMYWNYFPESSLRIPLIAVSYSLATFTGISRIYAGCHFATDVLLGAAVGTAIGFLVPWLHKVSTKETQIALLPNGVMVKKIL